MLKVYKILQYVFAVLSLIGALYIFFNDGNVSAGYAVIPMLFSVTFLNLSKRVKKKHNI